MADPTAARSSTSGGPTENPFSIPTVIANIYKYAALKDMRNLRLIDKLWYWQSLSRWRKDMWVKIAHSPTKSKLGQLFIGNYVEELIGKTSSDDFNKLTIHPIRKMRFNCCSFSLINEKGVNSQNKSLTKAVFPMTLESDSRNYWNAFGGSLTHLSIIASTFQAEEYLSHIIFRSAPNLEVLVLQLNNYCFKDFTRTNQQQEIQDPLNFAIESCSTLPVLRVLKEMCIHSWENSGVCGINLGWVQLIISSPKLKKLVVSPITGRELDVIGNTLSKLLASGAVYWSLEFLEMMKIQREGCVGISQILLSKLTELRIDATGFNGRELHSILQTCKLTLRILLLSRTGHETNLDGQQNPTAIMLSNYSFFPFNIGFEKLQELWLLGAMIPPNLSFLSQMPHLKKLLLISNKTTHLIKAGSWLCDEIKLTCIPNKLLWNGGYGNPPPCLLEQDDNNQYKGLVCSKLEEMVISRLDQMLYTPGHVHVLVKLMPNLRRLMLGLSNDGFRAVCTQFPHLESLVIQPSSVDEYGITGHIPGVDMRLPNLTHLKELRYFGVDRCADKCVNENAITNGVLQTTSLVDCFFKCSNEVSKSTLLSLKQKFPRMSD